MKDRYAVDGAEGEHEPGSDQRVLRNLVGITTLEDMNELELELLNQLYENLLLNELPERSIMVEDLRTWHHRWLGNVYPWAGQDRHVNMSKDGFTFAAAAQIPRLLAEFEKVCLMPWTPCHDMPTDTLVEAIATTHVEFILIHPFREGNGRLSRLLSDVMAVQAGHDPLDYSAWDIQKPAYIAAIHAGVARDYGPMQGFVRDALIGHGQDTSAQG